MPCMDSSRKISVVHLAELARMNMQMMSWWASMLSLVLATLIVTCARSFKILVFTPTVTSMHVYWKMCTIQTIINWRRAKAMFTVVQHVKLWGDGPHVLLYGLIKKSLCYFSTSNNFSYYFLIKFGNQPIDQRHRCLMGLKIFSFIVHILKFHSFCVWSYCFRVNASIFSVLPKMLQNFLKHFRQ